MNQVGLWSDETPYNGRSVRTLVCGAYGNPGVKVAVHVEPHADRTCGRDFPQIDHTMDIVSEIADLDVDVFPVFFALTEYLGLEYGLSWPGDAACIFTSCSGLEIGDIVNPGDGIAQVWFTCQPGPIAVPGWGWIAAETAGQVCVVPHPAVHRIGVTDCQEDGILDQPDEVFCAGIGGADGEWPFSAPSGAETTTWSKVKAIFE
jgi:hypothetical protein